jgi:hypothetical protein
MGQLSWKPDRRSFYPSPAIPKFTPFMNESSSTEAFDFTPVDELERLELRIAQRADDLSRESGFDPIHACENWRKAEREVLGELRD